MPDNSRTFEDKSRLHWTSSSVPDPEQVQVGALQRLAAATERMATATESMAHNYQQMQRDLDFYRGRARELEEKNKQLQRRLSAQRGATTRARNAGA